MADKIKNPRALYSNPVDEILGELVRIRNPSNPMSHLATAGKTAILGSAVAAVTFVATLGALEVIKAYRS